MSDTHSAPHVAPIMPPLPISECPVTTSKVVHVRGLPFAVTRFQIRQFFRAFQVEEEQPAAAHLVEQTTASVASADAAKSLEDSGASRKGFPSDTVSVDNGESRTPSNEEEVDSSSKHSTIGATTPRQQPRWSALTDMENSSIVWFPSGAHRGEGFIRLKYSEDVAKAVEFLDRNHFADRVIEVSASSEEARQICVDEFKRFMEIANQALVLRLRGLPFSAEEDDVRAFIRSVDGVVALDVCRDATGRNTGDAFIELESEANVAQAKLLHEKMMGRRYIEVLPSSAHDRLCVLGAAARKSGFSHQQLTRHATRGARGVPHNNNNNNNGDAAERYQSRPRASFEQGYRKDTTTTTTTTRGGNKGGRHGSYAPRNYASTGYACGANNMYYAQQSDNYGYGYYNYYNGSQNGNGYGGEADAYQSAGAAADGGWWCASQTSPGPAQQPAAESETYPARGPSRPASHKSSSSHGMTHNPYSYGPIQGPSAADSWGCENNTVEPMY